MQADKTRERIFSRRTALLVGGQVTLLSGLVARMYYLQIHQADRYRTLAEENRISLRLLPPPRGYIVDRFGEPMAVNVQNYRLVIIPEQAGNVAETLHRLTGLIEIGERDKRRVLREVRRRRIFFPVTVRDGLSWSEVSRLEVNAPDLPGVDIEVGLSRFYPQGAVAAHLLGYVSAVTEELRTGDPLLELPGFRIGKRGVEKRHDLALRGSAGSSEVEVNAIGRVIRELRRREGQPGQRVDLTIDASLQAYVAERLAGEKSAAVVVLDVRNGDVLAMVSTPSFNPNAFNEGLSGPEWRGLINNPLSPLTNKAITGQYAPGSTFKIAVMLAALEAGIPPEHEAYCPGHVKLGNQRFHCWKRTGHGSMTMIEAMRESCDVWFYKVALKLGIDKIAEAARRLGMGERLGVDLDGEKPGLIPTRAWKKAVIGRRWQRGETLIGAIGQGYVLTTPLQLAVMMARVINGGHAIVPRIQRGLSGDVGDEPFDDAEPGSIGYSPAMLGLVATALDSVVNNPRGTAYKSRIRTPSMAMGGKTGTAQVRRISVAERKTGVLKNSQLAWRERDHALFVGYAPVQTPRYAISVIVEHGGGGSSKAAPIAKDILTMAQKLDSSRDPQPARLARVTDDAWGID
ncbi:MAG: penicillin-binding protein 2 [Rhodospirillaceae bacterium]|jgi:penicillin-binding protein 2|nr:penicillin-binding protein 2 [Rhodospirillaceae bacterium]